MKEIFLIAFNCRRQCGRFAGEMQKGGADVRVLDPKQGRTLRITLPLAEWKTVRAGAVLEHTFLDPSFWGVIRIQQEIRSSRWENVVIRRLKYPRQTSVVKAKPAVAQPVWQMPPVKPRENPLWTLIPEATQGPALALQGAG